MEVMQNCCALNTVVKAYYGFSVYWLQPQPCNLPAPMVWLGFITEIHEEERPGLSKKIRME